MFNYYRTKNVILARKYRHGKIVNVVLLQLCYINKHKFRWNVGEWLQKYELLNANDNSHEYDDIIYGTVLLKTNNFEIRYFISFDEIGSIIELAMGIAGMLGL